MPVLVIAEHDNTSLKPGVLQTVAAARKLDADVHMLVAGSGCDEAAKNAAAVHGVAKILHADDAAYAHGLAENLALLIEKTVKAGGYTHVIAPATFFGKNVLPRAAAVLDVQQSSDVTGIESPDTFIRPIYAGNAFATVQSLDAIKVLTIRPTAFDAVKATGGAATIEKIAGAGDTGLSHFVSQEITKSERPDLSSARVIVSGGRGLGSGENFKALLEPLADGLNAALGASRAAVDAGYVPNDYQVGQTGRIVAPELYIAIGISGAIQHLAGMKDSKVIVAINKDAEAPIFGVANYGLVGDLFQILPELKTALAK
jgi:electron transfer flavoprotein alpha subunit